MNDLLDFLIKLQTYGSSLYVKLEKGEIIFLIGLLIIVFYLGFRISKNFNAVINTDFKVQCPTYTEIQAEINSFAVERWLTATTKNGKVITIGCPFLTNDGKCNKKEKCNKI